MTGTIQTCRCGTLFVQRPHHKSGKHSPICVDADPNGNVEVLADGSYRIIPKGEPYDGARYLNHFVNCPLAGSFSKRK